MSEVEKMYEYIGIGKKVMCEWTCKDNPECNVNCEHYESTQLCYPPFTPEKQLELIKWLGKSRPIHITFLCDEWNIESMVRYGKRYNTFENALCGYTNVIWQDLTETERNEIRDILKG